MVLACVDLGSTSSVGGCLDHYTITTTNARISHQVKFIQNDLKFKVLWKLFRPDKTFKVA